LAARNVKRINMSTTGERYAVYSPDVADLVLRKMHEEKRARLRARGAVVQMAEGQKKVAAKPKPPAKGFVAIGDYAKEKNFKRSRLQGLIERELIPAATVGKGVGIKYYVDPAPLNVLLTNVDDLGEYLAGKGRIERSERGIKEYFTTRSLVITKKVKGNKTFFTPITIQAPANKQPTPAPPAPAPSGRKKTEKKQEKQPAKVTAEMFVYVLAGNDTTIEIYPSEELVNVLLAQGAFKLSDGKMIAYLKYVPR
jgi:hypothetical protein